jgi:outer membrane lipoprotein-sorting protein
LKLRIFLCLALAALLWSAGCRTLPPPPPPVAAISSEDLLALLKARQEKVQSFQAKGRIIYLSPQQNYSGTAMLAGRLPASLKVDILDILGRNALSFATDGTEVKVLSPRENRLLQGPATPRNLAAFIPPTVSLPQALRLLVGALPLSQGPPQNFAYEAATDRYRLEWRQGDALTERLWVAAQGLYPVQEEWYGGAPEPRFTAELADFGALASDLPEKVTLKTPSPKMEMRLVYRDLKLNPPLTAADLTLTPPPGVVLVPLAK